MSYKKIIKGKKGQEEIVGFALIIIIVAVVLLFLLSFSLKSSEKEEVESTEVSSFLQASLQYTTECETDSGGSGNSGKLSLQDLIFECIDGGLCKDTDETGEKDSCEALNSTWEGIVEESWNVDDCRSHCGADSKTEQNRD